MAYSCCMPAAVIFRSAVLVEFVVHAAKPSLKLSSLLDQTFFLIKWRHLDSLNPCTSCCALIFQPFCCRLLDYQKALFARLCYGVSERLALRNDSDVVSYTMRAPPVAFTMGKTLVSDEFRILVLATVSGPRKLANIIFSNIWKCTEVCDAEHAYIYIAPDSDTSMTNSVLWLPWHRNRYVLLLQSSHGHSEVFGHQLPFSTISPTLLSTVRALLHNQEFLTTHSKQLTSCKFCTTLALPNSTKIIDLSTCIVQIFIFYRA